MVHDARNENGKITPNTVCFAEMDEFREGIDVRCGEFHINASNAYENSHILFIDKIRWNDSDQTELFMHDWASREPSHSNNSILYQ